MSTQYAFGKIVTNGLVMSLNASEKNSYAGSGNIWYDLSSNFYSGSFINSPTFVSSYGGAISFTGKEGVSYVTTSFGITNAFAIEVACKPTRTVTSSLFNFRGPIQSTPNVPGNYDRGIQVHFPWVDGNVYYDVLATDGKFYRWVKTGSAFNTNILNNVAIYVFTLDSSNNLRVYQNGNLIPIGFSQYSGSVFSGTVNLNDSNYVACFSQSTSAGNFWPGEMYSFRVYNRNLSQTEILQNYNAQKGRFGLT